MKNIAEAGFTAVQFSPVNTCLEGDYGGLDLLGAMTDFKPLIANPKSFLLGAAAQLGIYMAYFMAILLGLHRKAAAFP